MDQPKEIILEISGVTKAFTGRVALGGISFTVEAGEILVLLGPSGCGKTTLLRLIAGLDRPDAGQIFWRGTDLATIPVHQRGFGLVFQDFALFPHKNVADNVRFGLRMQHWPESEQDARLQEVLLLVGLAGFAERAVYDLSGGEQQRVALARALAPSPRLLLMDEPLGSLDRALRERLMGDLRDILKQAAHRPGGMTAIYVTHDQEEAFALADRVVVLNEGLVEQIDRPQDLYRRPATPFVARFLGMENVFPGRIVQRDPTLVQTPIGILPTLDRPEEGSDEVQILIRPDAATIKAEGVTGSGMLTGRVTEVSFRGRFQQVTINAGEADVPVSFDMAGRERPFVEGEMVVIKVDPAGVCLLY